MSVRLWIIPTQRMMAAKTPHRLDRDHHIHRLHRQHGPRLSLVAGLPTGPAPTGLAARPFPSGLGWIARGRSRGGARVLLQLLGQLLDCRLQALDCGLQHGDPRVKGSEILLRLDRRALPNFWWQRRLGIHGSRMVQDIDAGKQPFLASST